MLCGKPLTYYLAVAEFLQITSSTQDVIRLCAPTFAVSHPLFLPLPEDNINYSHSNPLGKVYHHQSFCIPVLDIKPTHQFLITSVPCSNMSIDICTNHHTLTSGDVLHHVI
ncbi:hypothetical protein ILYODFUR_011231 [Ilyodon furcidens]|uniref:Uncharacterized protein n=1 Tax=Ilyodon furcidens TaxID=33524 RepID=A0ABV0SZN6_9TELE